MRWSKVFLINEYGVQFVSAWRWKCRIQYPFVNPEYGSDGDGIEVSYCLGWLMKVTFGYLLHHPEGKSHARMCIRWPNSRK